MEKLDVGRLKEVQQGFHVVLLGAAQELGCRMRVPAVGWAEQHGGLDALEVGVERPCGCTEQFGMVGQHKDCHLLESWHVDDLAGEQRGRGMPFETPYLNWWHFRACGVRYQKRTKGSHELRYARLRESVLNVRYP